MCAIMPEPTLKNAVEAKRGVYARVSNTFLRKDLPSNRFVGSSDR